MSFCPNCEEGFGYDKAQVILGECLHSLCSRCLDDLKQIPKNEHSCKVCEEQIDVDNVFVAKVHAVPECDECAEATKSSHHCVTCNENYCSTHATGHPISKKGRSHTLEPIEGQAMSCTMHPNNQVSCLCDDCQTLVCFDCVTGPHKAHIFLKFDEAIAKYAKRLQQEASQVNKKVAEIDYATEELIVLQIELEAHLVSIIKEIESSFHPLIQEVKDRIQELQRLMAQLEARCRVLKDDTSNRIKADIKTIDSQLQSLQTTKQHIQLLQHHAQSSFVFQSDTNIMDALRLHGILSARAKVLENITTKLNLEPLASYNVRFSFLKPTDILLCDVDKLGRLFNQKKAIIYRDWKYIRQPSLVFGSHGRENGQFLTPCGVAQMNDGNLIVADTGNQRLQVFTHEGQFILTVPVVDSLRQIALSFDDEIWVASYLSNAVLCISIAGAISSRISVSQPRGLAISARGQLFVSSNDQRLRSFSLDGTLLWTSTGFTAQYFRGIAIYKEEVIVCDCSHDRLQVFSAVDGHFVRFLGVDQLASPTDVTLIPGTDMLIVAQAGRATILQMDNTVVHQWGTQGSQPGQFNMVSFSSVAVLQDGRLAFVENNNHRVQIF